MNGNLESKKTDIKNEVAFDSSYTNETQRRAREKELLKAPENISLERAVEALENQHRRHQVLVDSLKRLYTIRLIRFKSLLLTILTTTSDSHAI